MIEYLNQDNPNLSLRMLDVGARRGLDPGCRALVKLNHFHLEGIEPDAKEAQAILSRGFYSKVYPVAVAARAGKMPLYVTKVLGCTSIYKPNPKVVDRLSTSRWLEVQNILEINATTLNDLFGNGEQWDLVTLDTQGAECEILKGGERLLDDILCISMEFHVLEIYEGETLFPHTYQFLSAKGFRLIELSCGDFDGEMAEGHSIYIKDYELLTSRDQVLKCILFALIWGKEAYVENILRNAPERLLSRSERQKIGQLLGIKIKDKFAPWPDGFTGARYADGSGYG